MECLINALVLSHTTWLYLNLSKHNNRPSLFSSRYIWPVYHSNPSTEQSEVWTTIPVSQIHSIWKAIALVWFSSASIYTVDYPVTPGVLLWVFGWMLLASIRVRGLGLGVGSQITSSHAGRLSRCNRRYVSLLKGDVRIPPPKRIWSWWPIGIGQRRPLVNPAKIMLKMHLFTEFTILKASKSARRILKNSRNKQVSSRKYRGMCSCCC